MRDLALLKLFFADGVAPEDAAALARAAAERHEDVVAALEQVQAGGPGRHAARPCCEFGLDFHRWCAERFAQMEQDLQEED